MGKFRVAHVWIYLWLTLGWFYGLRAADGFGPLPERQTAKLEAYRDLSGGWLDSDHALQDAPFWRLSQERWVMTRFFKEDPPSDTLWLYFEKLAWEAEVWLDGSLLSLQETPFRSLLVPLPPSLMEDSLHVLTLRLDKRSMGQKFWPASLSGCYGKVWLMRRGWQSQIPVFSNWVRGAERAAFLAPWSPDAGPVADVSWFRERVKELKARGITAVYFPFEPPLVYLDICQKAGLQRLEDWLAADKLAFVNDYPQAWGRSGLPIPFWYDEEGHPTQNLGVTVSRTLLARGYLRQADRVALSVFLILALLGILLIKVLAPRLWLGLPEFLVKSKIYLELIRNGKFLKQFEAILLNIYRTALLSLIFSLVIYYLGLSGTWESLNILSDRSLLYQWYFATDYNAVEIFFQVWAYVGILNLLKYMVLGFVGEVFRIGALRQSMQGLDVFVAFPLLWLPLLPVTLLFFAPIAYAPTAVVLLVVTYLLYQIRLLIILYQGISGVFQFSTGIKILYICALEIVPWVIMI